jgi:hypothetical protein
MLYHITKKQENSDTASFDPVPLSKLAKAGWKEKDLENVLAKRIEYVVRGDQLMVIFQERRFQEEADILAVDEEGTLYIFELKRWAADQSNLLQVIRYGQIFGQYKYEELQELFRKYIHDTHASLREHHARHFEFDAGHALPLSDFNKRQQFVVVTAGVDIQTLEAIRYWRRHNLPISALTYHVYEYQGEFFIEFHSFSPDPDDYAALLTNNFVVNTNVTYRKEAYLDMLSEDKAAAYYSRKTAVDGIKTGDRVFLYHTGVGVCAMGRAKDHAQPKDYGGDPGEEHFVALKMEYKADPVHEPLKCVRASEINKAVSGSYRFRQTAFAITVEMAEEIERLLKEKHTKNST